MSKHDNKRLRKVHSSKPLTGAVAAAVLLAVPGSEILAQGALEEIVVTAQKREQSVQDVPASITAISASQMKSLNIIDPGRLELLTPGLTWGNSTGGRSWPTLRGVSTGNGEANGEASLAYHVDGVYKSRTAQANAPLVDIERIEVLRGPQGTLAGRNATGGAINVISKLPSTDAMEYGFEASVGNYSAYRADGYLNVPLSDSTAGRVAFRIDERDGYTENLGPGNDLNDEGLLFVRGAIRHEADRWNMTFRGSYMDRDRNGAGGFTPDVLGQTYDFAAEGRSVFGDPVYVNPRVLDGIPETNVNGTLTDLGVPWTGDVWEVNNDTQASEQTENKELSLEFNYEFGAFSFKSLTAWSDFELVPVADNDFTSCCADTNDDIGILSAYSKTFQQELQLTSNGDGPLEWVLGAFYFQDQVSEEFQIQRLLPGTALPAPGGGTTDFIFDRRTETDLDSYAVYGQASYHLTKAFQITAGARYTLDEKSYQLREFGFLGVLGFNPDVDIDEDFDEVTWRLGAEWF
ncbi:MAG: TonB-dependent receptor, partial [Pseudomonadales bacterium]